jgi:hypothetical protein
VASTEQKPRAAASRYDRLMGRIERWIAPISEEEEALEEVILSSENQRLVRRVIEATDSREHTS